MKNEKRQNTRVSVHFDVFIYMHGEKIPVQTWNLSMRGLQCSADKTFNEGEACTVVFVLSQEITFQIQGIILRTGTRDAGIRFESMEGESFLHLKRLVQYNTDDPDKIEDELAWHL
ncbi:MAG: PilZ domain-containing protein [Pseudomonadota bacterium]